MNENSEQKLSQPAKKRPLWLQSVIYGFGLSLLLLLCAVLFLQKKILPPRSWPDLAGCLVFLAVATGLIASALLVTRLLLTRFRWLFRRQMIRFYVFGAVCLVTLIALFYAVENWRGQRAWQKCKADFAARGETLDWNAFIPPPVPDEQNVFKAPKMTEWFVKLGRAPYPTNEITVLSSSPPLVVAEIRVVSPGTTVATGAADLVLDYRADVSTNAIAAMPADREKIQHWLDRAIAPTTNADAVKLTAPQSFTLRRKKDAAPIRIAIRAASTPTAEEMITLFPWSLSPSSRSVNSSFWRESMDENTFRILAPLNYQGEISAATYLKWTERFAPQLQLIEAALQRPDARIDGDYQHPFAMPMPNFVAARCLAQMRTARAQSYLLLDEPEKAWREAEQILAVNRLMKGTWDTLVSGMIQVAITGLYEAVVSDGVRLKVWREPQLRALQEQLEQINLLARVHSAFRCEVAGSCQTAETTSADKFAALFHPVTMKGQTPTFWQKIKDPLYLFITLSPRGWRYQNMALLAQAYHEVMAAFEPTRQQAWPAVARQTDLTIEDICRRWYSPYTVFARVAVPNFSKALQVTAKNQSLARLTYLACALERYHLQNGHYPETLDALMPQFTDKLPHDIIGGQPLKYRRTDDGHFVIYSIGWNEKDDGGVADKGLAEGDWVWGDGKK